jgi:mycothiol synthase
MKKLDSEQITKSYASKADYSKLLDLTSEILANRKSLATYSTPGDLDWWYCRIDEPDFLSTVPVWRKDDKIVAFAWLSRGWPLDFNADIFVHPDYMHLLPEALKMSEEWCARNGGGQFGVWAFDSDTNRIEVLLKDGYKAVEGISAFCPYPLDKEPVIPKLPEGFVVGALEDADVISRVEAQRSAFDSSLTVEQYERVRQSRTYRSDLDIVVKAPDGTVVAFCIVWLDQRSSYAVFEPVGCHKSYHRRGFGTVVLREGLHRLWAMGVRTACVLAELPVTPKGKFYHSVGFVASDIFRTYAKTVASK